MATINIQFDELDVGSFVFNKGLNCTKAIFVARMEVW